MNFRRSVQSHVVSKWIHIIIIVSYEATILFILANSRCFCCILNTRNLAARTDITSKKIR